MASESVTEFNVSNSKVGLDHGEKKSWAELRLSVRESRKEYASLVCRSPTSFQFHSFTRDDDDDSCCIKHRLYFLGVPQNFRENTLMFVDLPDDASHLPATPLPWKRTMTPSSSLHLTGMEELSREEQLLRERKRMDMFGITSYDYHDKCERFVFPACKSLFLCDDNCTSEPIIPMKVPTYCPNVQLDPKICPCNADWVAFIHCNDIWVVDVTHRDERRLTFTQKGEGDDSITAGVASFIVQEEFHRYSGYWWQPHSDGKDEAIERILYEEVNERDVMSVNVLASASDSHLIDDFKYPRAGTANASCTLKIVEIDKDSYGAVGTEVRERQLIQPLTTYFPWCEYIIRAGWTANGQVWASLFDRRQGRMCLVLIPLECFVPTTPVAAATGVDAATYPRMHAIYEESSYIWMKVHDLIHFFPQQNPNEITFLWGSEKTGYRHLYLVTASLASSGDVTMAMEGGRIPWDTREEDEMKALVLNERALTSGSWEILPHQLWVDDTRGLAYFMALKDSVLESHLYVTSYLHPRKPQRLTTPGFYHSVQLDTACSRFLTVYSSITSPPVSTIHTLTHSQDGAVVPLQIATLLAPSAGLSDLHCPSLFTYLSKAGHPTHGMIFKPHRFTAGVKYPTVLYVYGGPEVQLVTNAFKALKLIRLHMLAAEGYVVVAIDGRGSSCRGLQFEGWIKNRLGTVEIEDQVEGLHWISSQVDYIDLDRVAIHGWSYGGYLSLLGLAQRPDVFKLAICGAPVVQWTMYDTGYTERYMDLPDSNPEGYKLGSVLTYVERLPDEPNRLLVVHGLMDENVHLQHTLSLVEALVRFCKPYQLQVYPNERHGIRGVESNDHYKTTVFSFLQQHL